MSILEEILSDVSVYPFLKKMIKYDTSLFTHSINVAIITEYMLDKMNYMPGIKKDIVTGALLHDIGKVFIPKEILDKPGVLTSDEMDIVRKHTEYGYEFIKDFCLSDIVKDIVLSHHENEVGTGYPNHATLMFKETQIVSIADKYEAMLNKRPYKDEMSHAEVLMELSRDCRKITYGNEIFDILVYLPKELLRKSDSIKMIITEEKIQWLQSKPSLAT